MYKGQRDAFLEIVVAQENCAELIDSTGQLWVEVFIPPNDLLNLGDVWSSIVIPPKQVFFVDDIYNLIQVNSGAVLTCLFKYWNDDHTKRVPRGQEYITTDQVLVRFLQYEYYKKHGYPNGQTHFMSAIEKAYYESGLKMIEYIRRV